MDAAKADFLQHRFPILLRQIPSDTPAHWGKMTLQQMIEHFTDSVRIASGKTVHADVLTPPDQLEKMRAFLASDKPFRENTPNPLMPEVPAPVIRSSVEEAINALQKELRYFFSVFTESGLGSTRNPFFGDLNFEQNVQLLYKHALHHLRQFGVVLQPATT